MLMNVVLGAVAGYLTPMLEPKIQGWAESIMLAPVKFKRSEFDLLAMLVLLLGASVLLALIGVDSSAFLLVLGAILGLFGKRIWASLMAKSPKSDGE